MSWSFAPDSATVVCGLIRNRRLTRASIVIAALAFLVLCSPALADETVQVCGSYANNVFTSGSVPAISATGRCPTASYNGGGFGLFNSGNSTKGQAGRWQTATPAGLELVGATASQLVSYGINDDQDYGGGFYWAGGGVGTNDQSPSTLGMVFPSPSTYFGMQLLCGKGTCKAPAGLTVGAFALYVRETSGPTLNSPSGLWQTTGWIRGSWPFVLSGDSPSGLCSLSASLNRQLIDTTTSGQDVSSWHQCAASPISQTIDTSRYREGAVGLALSAGDAAGVPASLRKTIYIDNSTPTISLSADQSTRPRRPGRNTSPRPPAAARLESPRSCAASTAARTRRSPARALKSRWAGSASTPSPASASSVAGLVMCLPA